MKVLHLVHYDRKGGACIAAYRQHQALVRSGVDSQMWVRNKVTADSRVLPFLPPADIRSRMGRIGRRRLLAWERKRSGILGEMFDDRSEHGGRETGLLPEHDVLNVQFSQGFIDLPGLYGNVGHETPVVVTLHEMSMFTGGCSYAYGCRNFEGECGECPLLANRGPNDFSHRSWHRKREAYARRPNGTLHFVADSHWLAREARQSALLRDYSVDVIHYGIDSDVFQPRSKQSARDLLGLPQDRPIIAFAAASVADERKGVALLARAIEDLPEKPFLLTWGAAFPTALDCIPHLHLGAIESEHLSSVAYNACDFFVIPSLEEAFGQTCLEAMACGRPVVGFDVGGIPDMIRHEHTGLLVPRGDVSGLAKSIHGMIEKQIRTESMGRAAREMVMERFTFAANAAAYRKLYERMLAGRA